MHSFAPEIVLITILSLVVFSDALANRIKIPSVFILLIGSYIIYTHFKIAVPLNLVEHFDTIILFCIPLIFMGDALHLHFSDIKKHAWSIFYLVTPEKPKHLPKIGTLEVIKGYNNNQET